MYTLKLIFKNAFRHKLRTGLTMLGVAVAILAFGLLRTVVDAWYAGVAASSANRLVTRNAVSLIFPMPLAYKEKIRQVPGVKTVSYSNWFGGVYIDEKNFFPNFAIAAKTHLQIYPEFLLTPREQEAFLQDRKGAVAGRKVAARYGWKLGDTVTLKGTIYPGNWEFVLRGIYKGKYKSTDETLFMFHWDYLNESLKKTAPSRADQPEFYVVEIADPAQAADVSLRIDALFKNSLAETLTETEKAFNLGFVSMSEAILVAIQLVSIVVIIIILAVVANTMAMTARERIGEYAIFKTMGFGGWYIARLIFGESLFITLGGCAFGIIFTFPAAKAFVKAMGNFIPVFNVTTATLYLDVAAAVLVGLLAALIPTWRAIKIPIAEGLRRIG
jgi:putative ABC transport system permease protein